MQKIIHFDLLKRSAIVVLVAVLLLGSFGSVANGQTSFTQAQMTSATGVSFNYDLTIGSQGTEVAALQGFLISKGFVISAGATGYFGMQTKAALSAFQAANGIIPAVGYFGPVTRAKVNAMQGSGSGSTPPPADNGGSSNQLRGGEADLSHFNLRSEATDGSEGEQNVEIATAKFDVEDADVRIERVELTVQATGSGSLLPWKYFDSVSVYTNGKKLATENADRKSNWDKNGTEYTITFTGLKSIVRKGGEAELTFVADISEDIDSSNLSQQFNVWVGDKGIRAVDGTGIQHYIGNDADTVRFNFSAEKNGKLSIRENKDNPDASVLKVEESKTSDEYTVFTFDVRNTEDIDTLVTKLSIGTSLTGATSTGDVIRDAVLTVDGDDYRGDIENVDDGSIVFDDLELQIDGKDTVTFELAVKFASLKNRYLSGDEISFDLNGADIEAEGAESGDEVTGISGTVTSEIFTLSTTGFMVSPKSTSSSVNDSSSSADAYGTYTIKFDVTADKDEPVYIAKTAASSTSATAGAVYNVLKEGSVYNGTLDTQSSVLTSSARTSNGVYVVSAGKTETFTLTVSLDPSEAGFYSIELNQVHYGLTSGSTADNVYSVNTNNADFETDVRFITE